VGNIGAAVILLAVAFAKDLASKLRICSVGDHLLAPWEKEAWN